jgi:hypothetical protein
MYYIANYRQLFLNKGVRCGTDAHESYKQLLSDTFIDRTLYKKLYKSYHYSRLVTKTTVQTDRQEVKSGQFTPSFILNPTCKFRAKRVPNLPESNSDVFPSFHAIYV